VTEFIAGQMDYVFFLYGLAFILLAAVCVGAQWTSKPRLRWAPLGLFAVSHGLNEWLDMVVVSLGDDPWLHVLRPLLLAVSFVFLTAFGLTGILAARSTKTLRLIMLPPVALVALGGLAGWQGFAIASRYCLGLPGGLLSAVVLLLAWKHDAGPRRWWLAVASVTMALYALAAGLVVPRAGFPPASWLNQETFQAAFGVPIQLVRGALAICLAVSVYAYASSVRAAQLDVDHAPVGYKMAVGRMVAAIAVVLSIGWVMAERAGRKMFDEIRQESSFQSVSLAGSIADAAGAADAAVKAMAGSPWISPALTAKTPPDVDRANSVLDRYNDAAGSMVSYLIDAAGAVVASSNRANLDSLVGKSCASCPCFRSAFSGRASGYYAVGATSGHRGYHTSHPVLDGAGRVAGVAVIVTDISRSIRGTPQYGRAFFVDPHGVIFLSDEGDGAQPAPLWPLADAVRAELAASRQFGELQSAALLDAEPRDGAEISVAGAPHFVSRLPMPGGGWSVVVTHSLQAVRRDRLVTIFTVAAVCLLIVTFFIALQSVEESNLRTAASEHRYRTLVENVNVGVYRNTGGPQGRFLQANPALARMLGYDAVEDLMSAAVSDLYEFPDDRRRFVDKVTRQGYVKNEEVRLRRKDGSPLRASITARVHYGPDGRLAWIDGIIEDVTDRKRYEEQLAHMASHDPLTDRPNRRLLEEALDRTIARARRGTPSVLALFDLDSFKLVNDTFGHAAGDEVLVRVARLVQESLRAEDILARLGGDEFAFVLDGVTLDQAAAIADRARLSVAAAFPASPDGPRTSLSIGLAEINGRDDARAAVAKADAAMYQAKQEGGNRIVSCRLKDDGPAAGAP
jgi:diguanylate cyclase (GGDEF)-like protein/PAS domain S-box-containing protein